MNNNTEIEFEIKLRRLLTLANFISGIRMAYPLDPNEQFHITKKNSGYEVDSDNFTFTWIIGLFPLLFGKHWAYSNEEKLILKEHPDIGTAKAIQLFFGLSINEYFQIFVAYFQEEKLKPVPHNNIEGKLVAENIREVVRYKMLIHTSQQKNGGVQET